MKKGLDSAGKSLVFEYQISCLKIVPDDDQYSLGLVNIPVEVTYPNRMETVLKDYKIQVTEENVDQLCIDASEERSVADLGSITKLYEDSMDEDTGILLVFIGHMEPKVKKVDDSASMAVIKAISNSIMVHYCP